MLKKTMIFLSLSIVLSLFIVGAIIYKDIQETAQEEERESTEKSSKDRSEEAGDVEPVVAEQEQEEIYENPFGESIHAEDLSLEMTQEYIHKMSHQKVIAEAKWGFFEITDERIGWLLDIVEQSDFPGKKTYKAILTRWKNDDFSNIIEDHNIVWRLQGGTIGEATGTLSEEEEQLYKEETKEQ